LHPKLFKPVDSHLEYIIYKDIDPHDAKKQVQQVCSIAPILSGQTFHDQFEIPAYKKRADHEPLNLDGLKQALPKGDSDDEDEFVDASGE